MSAPWHHGPLHILLERGVYMVTAGTHLKEHHFRAPERLHGICDKLHEIADEYGWCLQAWAVLSNHYHFIASSPDDPTNLKRMIGKLHTLTAKSINEADAAPGREVWHQYWDTRLTFETSYLARLNYVNQNAVHHRIVTHATTYPWCSAAQFEADAEPGFRRTVTAMPINSLNIDDDY